MGQFSRLGNALYEGKVSINFVGRKWLWYSISGLIVLLAVYGLVGRGLNYGIEFKGGVEYQVSMQAQQVDQANVQKIRDAVAQVAKDDNIDGAAAPIVNTSGPKNIRIQTEPLDNDQATQVSQAIQKAVASPKGWAGIGGKPAWGFITLGHTDPNKSNSGMQAIALMAYEYFHVTSGLTVEQMLDPKFQDFVKDIERGVSHFESSSETFMTDMVRFGPSGCDIAVVYESLAVAQLDNAQGRWGNLHIYYPPVTIWSDHPIVVLDAPWVSPDQARAGARLIEFLRSAPIQATALRFGFRPANTSVPMTSSDPTSPFARAMKYGLSLELPSAVQPPDASVVRTLMMMWSRVARPQ